MFVGKIKFSMKTVANADNGSSQIGENHGFAYIYLNNGSRGVH